MRLIDADELIKDIDCSADMGGALGKVVECVKYYAKFMVASAPTIEERKKGKWIRGDAEKLIGSQRCSICHKACYKGNDYFNYCPNCGADMRGET